MHVGLLAARQAEGEIMGILDGKVAIVTGGTSGIGERIAEVFVEEGAQVVVAARREAEGKALEKRLGIRFIRADVSNEEDVIAVVDGAPQRLGRVDCLVNNAAVPFPMTSITNIQVAAFDQVMAVNVRGVFLCMKHVASAMIARGSGSIVNIASISGHCAGVTGHAYAASKGAVLMLTRSAAAELGEKSIRVNSISPGGIVTGIFGKYAGVDGSKAEKVVDAVRGVFATLSPIPRAGETDDIARACVYLASDASTFLTGQDITIDGGVSSVIRNWSEGLAFRADLGDRIKAAAASL
jgi:NAD(P)-dependent dehydrogenase (short-subunit alcohol dehydrogenase family)